MEFRITKGLDTELASDHPTILIMLPQFLPGYKAGGPVRSIANLVDQLGDEYNFKIITSDRDYGDTVPYPGIFTNTWMRVSKSHVMYISPHQQSLVGIYRILRQESYDFLYLNGVFPRAFSMFPLWLIKAGWLRRTSIILAPRGEFSPGALQIKHLRKKIYLWLAKIMGLFKGLIWQASSEHEYKDIENQMYSHFNSEISGAILPVSQKKDQNNLLDEITNTYIATDLSGSDQFLMQASDIPLREKVPGELKVVFLSRISRMKNLAGALAMLQNLKYGHLQFHIYGPLEDKKYWAECEAVLKYLPTNIEIEYRGEVKHEDVGKMLSQYHLFFLPTLGENFGHVIAEALVSGCPVLISNRTPWRNLEINGVGWDISLEEPERFLQILQKCIAMSPTEFNALSKRANSFGLSYISDPGPLNKHRKMFKRALDLNKSMH